MMQGLQVFDDKGNLVFDAANRITIILGQTSLAPNQTLIIYNDAFAEAGTPFILTTMLYSPNDYVKYSVSGNALTLQYINIKIPYQSPNIITVTYGTF